MDRSFGGRSRLGQRRRWVVPFVVPLLLAALAIPAIANATRARSTTQASDTPTFSSLAAAFRDPPLSARPKIRWWWAAPLDSKEIAAEVGAIADAGFGGAEITFSSGAWATQAQRDALTTALNTARTRGISMDETMGAGWPITTPNSGGDSSSPYHAQELAYGVLNLAGPAPYDGPVPPPQDLGEQGGGLPPSLGPGSSKLVAVVAGRVAGEGTPVAYPAGVAWQPAAPTAPVKSPVLDASSLINLTSAVDSSGNVQFTPPSAGHWVLFALYQRPTAQAVMDHLSTAAANAVTGYLDANQIGGENQSRLIAGSQFFEDSLEISFNGIPWTSDLLATFKRLWGYDLTPYLPTLFIQDEYTPPGWDPREMPKPDYDVSGGVGARVRHDFFKTLDYMYVHNHLDVFEKWAEGHGMRFRAQVGYGSFFDMSQAALALDTAGGISDVESRDAGDPAGITSSNWHFAFDLYRAMAGGAHQAGENLISSELGATNARDYMTSLSEYKAMMDKQWAAGVSDPIVHGFAYQPPASAWPGRDQFGGLIAQSWNQRYFPEWSMWKPLTDYWARGDFVLQSGTAREDIAIYRDAPTTAQNNTADDPESIANYRVDPQLPTQVLTDSQGGHPAEQAAGLANPPPFFNTQPLESAGYTLEYIDPAGLTDPRAAGDGVLYPHGPSYRALVIDQSTMSGDAAAALAQASSRGLAVVIVGAAPTRGASDSHPQREDAQVKAAFKLILASPRTKVAATESDVPAALASIGVEPALSFSQPEAVYSQHRTTPAADLWYLWNADSKTASFTASFATSGAPSTLDLWSGEVERVARYRLDAGRVSVPITLRPGQTMVLAFDRATPAGSLHVVATNAKTVLLHSGSVELQDTSAGRRWVALSNGQWRSVTLPSLPAPLSPGTWHLHVAGSDPSGTSTYDVDLTSLQDWQHISQLQGVSGVGAYTTTINVPNAWLASGRGVYLDLGQFDGTIQAYLNGQLITPTATSDTAYTLAQPVTPRITGSFDVTRLLRGGANELKIGLATTLENAVMTQNRQGSFGSGSLPAAAVGPAQPYGLLGPVTFQPYGTATIRTGVA